VRTCAFILLSKDKDVKRILNSRALLCLALRPSGIYRHGVGLDLFDLADKNQAHGALDGAAFHAKQGISGSFR
jgi:hypothetical protein